MELAEMVDVRTTTSEKLQSLKSPLAQMGSVLVAYPGGTDSTFLLKVASDVLDDKVLAVTASSETYPPSEVEEATRTARRLGVRHIVITTSELENEDFAANPPDRCYYCKKELFSKLLSLAQQHGLNTVVDGSNFDDVGDYRPGMTAASELGVRSPLKEVGLAKAEIRALSRKMGPPTWDKSSFPCLSMRFP